MGNIDAAGLNEDSLYEVIQDPDVDQEALSALVDELRLAKTYGKFAEMQKLMKRVSHLARGFGLATITDPEIYSMTPQYWGNIRGQYIDMGDQYAATLIYDTVDNQYYVTDWETYVQYVESEKTPIWEVRYTIDDEVGYVYGQYLTFRAETEKEAIKAFVDMVESGDEDVWGDDDNFDLGMPERTEPRGVNPMDQMWYVTGFDPDQEFDEDDEDWEPETLVKAVRIAEVKQIPEDEVRGGSSAIIDVE